MATHSIDKIIGLYDSFKGNGVEVFNALAKASKQKATHDECIALLDTAVKTQQGAPLVEWLTAHGLLAETSKSRYPEVEEMKQRGLRLLPDLLALYPRKVMEDLRERALLDLSEIFSDHKHDKLDTAHDLVGAIITFDELLGAYMVDEPSVKRAAESLQLGVIDIESDMQTAVANVLRHMADNDNLLVL